jgi:hypothetical protein
MVRSVAARAFVKPWPASMAIGVGMQYPLLFFFFLLSA